MKLGIRIDVDTFRGTRLGVPVLCDTLAKHGLKGSFFFSVGPDNMGRHLWRLLKPAFLIKMLRSNAASLYGWDILLRGTFFPGPVIGEKCATEIKRTFDEGHEIGLHAWDHHAWQAGIDRMSPEDQYRHLEQGFHLLTRICGTEPTCSAAPGWKANEDTLLTKERFPFVYNSDCRGTSLFRPEVDGKKLAQPQIPVTLPTYDEVVGSNGITNENYNEYILSQLRPGALNVLTIHAEVEGIICRSLFDQFLAMTKSRNVDPVPLGQLLNPADQWPGNSIVSRPIGGREGSVAFQRD